MLAERALRLLDTLDGVAYALRLVCAGYWGRRLLTAALLCLSLAAGGLPGILG
jgi:hypothetical protein